MITTEYLTDAEINALDPDKLCVAHDSGDGDLYVTGGVDVLAMAEEEEMPPTKTMSEALDYMLNEKRRDSFEILMVNKDGKIVILQPRN